MKKVILLCLFLSVFTAHANEIDLARLQTAFIEKMIHYVEWPPYEGDSFVILIRQDDRALHSALQSIEDKLVLGKDVKIFDGDKPKNPQVLILKTTSSQKFSSSTGTLIITQDSEGLTDASMINFFLEDGKLRFDINHSLAQKKGLKINSRLLKLARYVK